MVVFVICTYKEANHTAAKDEYLCSCGMKRVFGCTKNRDKWPGAVTTLRSVLERLPGDSHKTYCVFGPD